MRNWALERGIDLAATAAAAPSLEVGDAVAWGGSGQAAAHGILMEMDTAEGNGIVHTCEVVNDIPGGPQLSPTGKTIKIDAAKLRASSIPVIGTVPVGPELSESPDVGTAVDLAENDDDETFWSKVQRQMRRMGGGFGAE